MVESNGPNRYVVLVDVIDSRAVADRQQFRDRLARALDAVNDKYANAIETPFEVIKGIDEFGAILTQLSPLYDLLDSILNAIHPTHLRVAVTSGRIDIGESNGSISKMDGPAFHRADSVLDAIEADGLYLGVDTGRSADALLETSLNLLLIARESRTERQVEVVTAFEEKGTQTAAASQLEISPQAVSTTLQRIDYHRLMTLRERVQRTCEEIYD